MKRAQSKNWARWFGRIPGIWKSRNIDRFLMIFGKYIKLTSRRTKFDFEKNLTLAVASKIRFFSFLTIVSKQSVIIFFLWKCDKYWLIIFLKSNNFPYFLDKKPVNMDFGQNSQEFSLTIVLRKQSFANAQTVSLNFWPSFQPVKTIFFVISSFF